MEHSVQFTLNVISLVLAIISIIGLIYLTQMSFNAKLLDNYATVDNMSDSKLLFAKTTVVLVWIQIAIALFIAIWNVTSKA